MIFFFADKLDVNIPAIAKCLDYLKSKSEFVPGHTEELVGGIRCVISSYNTVNENQAFWEAHRRYADVHCVIRGEERVSVCALEESQIGTYHPERDYLEVVGVPTVDIRATAGTVLCLFPNDVHRTKVNALAGQGSAVLKAIFKVPVELLLLD